MSRDQKLTGMNRRKFLQLGLVGTTSTLLAGNALAEAVQGFVPAAKFKFSTPVYRTLGRTGLKVSVVGFGAMLTPEPEVIRVAFEHGVNYVNTSRKSMAGKNEEIVGKALRGFRDKVFVATKIQTELNTKDAIIKDVEASLKALGTDYIDVIQLDANADKERIFRSEPREAFARLIDILFIGIDEQGHASHQPVRVQGRPIVDPAGYQHVQVHGGAGGGRRLDGNPYLFQPVAQDQGAVGTLGPTTQKQVARGRYVKAGQHRLGRQKHVNARLGGAFLDQVTVRLR